MESANSVVPAVQPRMIGARVERSEDTRLLTGRGMYLDDLSEHGEYHVAFVRSTMGHARIVSIDVEEARSMAGVRKIWTADDVRPVCEGMEGALAVDGCVTIMMPLLADGTARFVGEALVAIVADSRAIAEDASERVVVDYEPYETVVDAVASRAGGPQANRDLDGNNIALEGNFTFGDVDGAFDRAAQVVGATYNTGRLAPLPLEGRGCIADFDWPSDMLTVWAGSQVPHLMGYFISLYGGFPEQNVEVITAETGGGFGLKAHVYPEDLVVCFLARELNHRVKWIEDRTENLAAAVHAHQQTVELSYALDADGKIIGQRMDALGDGGAYHSIPWSMAVEPWCTAAMNGAGVYDIAAWSNSYTAVATNKAPVGAYRGVGYMAGAFVHEALADEAARKLGVTPFDFRRKNVVKEFPYTNPQGILYEEGSWSESIDVLEEMVGYEHFLKRQAELRTDGRYIGLGISVFVESSGESTQTSLAHGLTDTYMDTATVRMDPQGGVTVTTGLTSQGQGNRATIAQVAADTLGVRMEDITVICGDSTRYTWGSGTVGSRAGVVASGAVMRAGNVIRERLGLVAANLLEANAEDISFEDGNAFVVGTPDKAISIEEVATALYFDVSMRPQDMEPALEATLSYDPARAMFSNGAHAFLVEVDVETGIVSVDHAYAVEDCGQMINPDIVEGQIRGGMTQGLGAALLEELVYDEDAQLKTGSLIDYMAPTADVVPRFSFRHIETHSNHSPAGIKGMGESGLIASPGAMLNAVNDALSPLGVTMREIPLTPERIMTAIDEARS